MRVVKLDYHSRPRPGVYYCGRKWAGWPESPVANPCSARGKPCPVCGKLHYTADGKVAEAGPSVECFRAWLWGRIRANDRPVIDFLTSLPANATLACWCLSADDARTVTDCHTGVVARAAEWLRSKAREQRTYT